MTDSAGDIPFMRSAHIVPQPEGPVQPPRRQRGQREFERLFPGQPCFYCGGQPNSVDHMIPRSRGGKGGENLVPCCSPCNQMKGCMTVPEFIDHMELVLHVLKSKRIQFGGGDVIQYPVAA